MNRQSVLGLSALALLALLLWGPALSAVIDLVDSEASQLTVYLVQKGLFAAALVVVLAKWDGLKNYGFKRCLNWWFLLPALPIFALTALMAINPEAPYGLGLAAAMGWALASIFISIGEEGLFRGLIWRALEDRGPLLVSLLTSVLFGGVHLVGLFAPIPWEIAVSQAVFAMGFGMILAAVRLVSGSLVAPIALHALFDMGAIIPAGGVMEMLSEELSPANLLVPGIAFFAWGLICVLVIRRRRGTSPTAPSVALAP